MYLVSSAHFFINSLLRPTHDLNDSFYRIQEADVCYIFLAKFIWSQINTNSTHLSEWNRALGGLPHLYPTLEIAREVNINYPTYAASTFGKTFAISQDKNKNKEKKFQFWYVSGKAVERDLTKPLWILQDARRIKVSKLTVFPGLRFMRFIQMY